MLACGIFDYIFIFPVALILFFLTLSFFKTNTISSLVRGVSNDKKNIKTKVFKKNYNFIFIKQIILYLFLLFFQNFFYRGYTETF